MPHINYFILSYFYVSKSDLLFENILSLKFFDISQYSKRSYDYFAYLGSLLEV